MKLFLRLEQNTWRVVTGVIPHFLVIHLGDVLSSEAHEPVAQVPTLPQDLVVV